MLALVGALALLALGCSGRPAEPPRPSTAPARTEPAAPAAAPPTLAEKWACSVDDDCMRSCAHGAVSKAWYARTRPPDGVEGCCGDATRPPECMDGSCYAIAAGTMKTMVDPSCTHRP